VAAKQDTVRLKDGSRLVIRPIRADDKGAIASGFERLSPESRYRRFFAPIERLTEQDLVYLTEVDHHDHEALIGFDRATRRPIAAARFIRGADPTEAEVAVTVVDEWHGRGVATAMLEHLVVRAREEGIDHFIALVVSDNREALELFEHLADGSPPPRRSESGYLELVIELPEPETEITGSRLGRALRAAARGVVMNPWGQLRESIRREPPPDDASDDAGR
jgi:GNAT superfamily N-acetyltransferase